WALQPAPPVVADDASPRRTPTVRTVEKVGPAVVNITTERIVRSPFRSPFPADPFLDRYFEEFFEPRRSQTVQSLGSGVLIDAHRHVLTNAHVVSRASAIRVTLADGRDATATLIGVDERNDLAVLRVETDEDLPWIELGHSNDLLVGEPVVAIGNPHGFSNTVTTGVISAVDRSLTTQDGNAMHGLIQTDASINPGNSGGPLLNAEGTLIGINTAVFWRSDQPAQMIGFAIPIDVAKRVIDELITYGAPQPVWLGLYFQDLDPSLHDVLSLPEQVRGVIVNGVEAGSPGAEAGIERGDIVTQMDARTLRNAQDFYASLRGVRTNQRIDLTVWRDGATLRRTLVARELPLERALGMSRELLGLEIEANRGGGFVVRRVASKTNAERIGFQPGDVLLAVNGQELDGERALRDAMADLRYRSGAQLVVARGANRYHVTLPVR
ncbi:MAG: trypsin-like peptidase domain-containing protein, partial [Myxococcales bacterium]|nr:trypsin-like peptidase domain-containing protein [Myxococcales bacterium]